MVLLSKKQTNSSKKRTFLQYSQFVHIIYARARTTFVKIYTFWKLLNKKTNFPLVLWQNLRLFGFGGGKRKNDILPPNQIGRSFCGEILIKSKRGSSLQKNDLIKHRFSKKGCFCTTCVKKQDFLTFEKQQKRTVLSHFKVLLRTSKNEFLGAFL